MERTTARHREAVSGRVLGFGALSGVAGGLGMAMWQMLYSAGRGDGFWTPLNVCMASFVYRSEAKMMVDDMMMHPGMSMNEPVQASHLAVGAGLHFAFSAVVGIAFALGAALPITILRWNPAFQLESGPAWFAVLLLLADRRFLPNSNAARPLLGLAAGVTGVAPRVNGFGVEAVFLAVAGLQLSVALLEGAEWLRRNRYAAFARVQGLRRSTNWSRRGPTPIRSTGAPTSDSISSM